MGKIPLILFFIFFQISVLAQTDTITPVTQKLLTEKLFASKSTYLVYWEDETGNVSGSAELWKRELQLDKNEYLFDWKWYKNDTLYAHTKNVGSRLNMEPKLHHANYFKKGKFTVAFNNGVVSIPDSAQTKESHKTFKVNLQSLAFAFPMDLEILGLLPFKHIGQQFAISFYEPGSHQSAFYNATVMEKSELMLPANQRTLCWVLRLNYALNSYADFWIAPKTREVLKMKEYYNGKYRYKIKLY